MNLKKFQTLITNLPVRLQCFDTKRSNWGKQENEFDWLKKMNNNLFGKSKTLKISRQDIFDTEDVREKILKLLYWGYPNGMRGNNFTNILNNIQLLEDIFRNLSVGNQLRSQDFDELKNSFHSYIFLLYFCFSTKYNC